MKHRLFLAVGGLLVAGVAATTAWYARYDYDPTAGPIDSSENGLGFGAPVEVGQEMSIGITTLRNDGRKPAVVKRVRLLGVTGPLELLGVHTRPFGQPDVQLLLGEFGFPAPGYPSKPLAEQNVVPPPKLRDPTTGKADEGLELVIGIRPTGPGITAYRAVEVHYRVGDRDYREVWEANSVHLCAPLSEYVNPDVVGVGRSIQDCPPPELRDKFEDRVLEWPPPSKEAAER